MDDTREFVRNVLEGNPVYRVDEGRERAAKKAESIACSGKCLHDNCFGAHRAALAIRGDDA